MGKLVKIKASPVPPTHQSTELIMACPRFYVEAVIKGRKKPGGVESARGLQIHRVHGAYQSVCKQRKVRVDYAAFDELAKGAGAEAARILSGVRDSYEVDYPHLVDTETVMSLDKNFRPTCVAKTIPGHELCDTGDLPEFVGIPDSIYAYPEDSSILIPDWKSHPRPFDPDETLQAKMYSLFIFQHFPWCQKVTFRLYFVRYKKLTREVIFERKDVPALIEAARAARERQKMIHFDYDRSNPIEAIPGAHCQYCPLLSDRSCPIAEYNPALQLTYEERLKFMLWYSAFSKINTATMKEHVDATGRPIVLRDYNGKAYVYGPVSGERFILPLFLMNVDGKTLATDDQGIIKMPIADKLIDWQSAYPDDVWWFGDLEIKGSALKTKLKTNKRAILDQAVKDAAIPETTVKIKVSKPLDVLEEDTEGEEEEEDF